MKNVEFDVYIHVRGTLVTDENIEKPDDLIDAIFDEEADFEIDGVSTDANFLPAGYLDVEEIDEDE